MEAYVRLQSLHTAVWLEEREEHLSADAAAQTVGMASRPEGNGGLWRLSRRPDGAVRLLSASGLSLHVRDDIVGDGSARLVAAASAAGDTEGDNWLCREAASGTFRLESRALPHWYLTAAPDGAVVVAPGESAAALWRAEEATPPLLDPLPDVPARRPMPPVSPQPLRTPYRLEKVEPGAVKLDGYVGESIRYVYEEQILRNDWRLHVDQFRRQMDTYGAWRGEFWGKMMRGACQYYAYTQDEELYRDLAYTVQDLLTCQETNGRISTYPAEDAFTGWDTWCRKYVMLGLEAFYAVSRDETLRGRVLGALCRHADAILEEIGDGAGQIPIVKAAGDWRGMPACSILEPMVILYQLTGYERYWDFATEIVAAGGADGANIFELAYADEQLPYTYMPGWAKAYEMSSCFEGLALYAMTGGSEKWQTAVLNYVRRVLEAEITVAGSGGGDGPTYNVRGMAGEQWNRLGEEQTNPDGRHMQETCVTVTWLKLCERALRMTADPTIADAMEITTYNALLGAIKGPAAAGATGPAADFLWDYFSVLNGTRNHNGGGYCSNLNSCCPANGPSAAGLLPFLQVMRRAAGPVVNFYNPGEVRVKTPGQGIAVLTFETAYPAEGKVQIRLHLERPESFSIDLRIPAWSLRTTLTVNGEPTAAAPGRYATLTREWQDGDVIRLELDLRTRAVPCPAGQKTAAGAYTALLRGPVVLARDARFGDGCVMDGVHVLRDADGYARVRPLTEPPFAAHMAFLVETEEGLIGMTDYASAGSTWSLDSQYAVWLPAHPLPVRRPDTDHRFCCEDGSRRQLAAGDAAGVCLAAGSPASCWRLEIAAGDRTYRIRHVASGQYLARRQGSPAVNGAPLTLVARGADNEALWRLMPVSDSTRCYVIHAATGLLLSMTHTGDTVHLWEDIHSPLHLPPMQIWSVEETSDDRPPIRKG